jgi:uncharacterized protein
VKNITVDSLHRYPVKSMRGQTLERAEVNWNGFEEDRRYAFMRTENRSGFPWLTGTKYPALTLYTAQLEPSTMSVRVTDSAGIERDLYDPDLTAQLEVAYGEPLRVTRSDRGIFDEFPISIVTRQSLTALEHDLSIPMDNRRFRANFVLDTADDQPFVEDQWVGSHLEFSGGLVVRITTRDVRCSMINLEPDSANADPRVLKHVVRHRENCLGVYGHVEQPGWVGVGETVLVHQS